MSDARIDTRSMTWAALDERARKEIERARDVLETGAGGEAKDAFTRGYVRAWRDMLAMGERR